MALSFDLVPLERLAHDTLSTYICSVLQRINLTKLHTLASVSLGTLARPTTTGCVVLLQPNNLNDFQSFLFQPENFVDECLAVERATLQPGDVLLPAKGPQLRPLLVTEACEGVAASAGFFILRCRPALHPAYLVAYLAHPWGQQQLRELLNPSTTVAALNKSALLGLEVPLLALPVQQRLGKLHQAWLREQELTQALLARKQEFYQQTFAHIVTVS